MKQRNSTDRNFWIQLALPSQLFLFLFFLGPLIFILLLSFLHRGTYGDYEWIFQIENYVRLFSSQSTNSILRSLILALETTVICVPAGFIISWAMMGMSPAKRLAAIAFISLPFFSSLIVRVYAIRSFVGMDGPLQRWLHLLGLNIDPFVFSAHQSLVLCGMLLSYLPFAVFPIYSAFEKFDFLLIDAAHDLGANDWQIFKLILLPGLSKGLTAAFLLVFTPALGEFVIPELLGGGKVQYFGNLITDTFLKSRDWPFGAALSVIFCTILGIMALAGSQMSSKRSYLFQSSLFHRKGGKQ
jgi:spermidine/putrescine transport system permease protein